MSESEAATIEQLTSQLNYEKEKFNSSLEVNTELLKTNILLKSSLNYNNKIIETLKSTIAALQQEKAKVKPKKVKAKKVSVLPVKKQTKKTV